MDSKRSKKPILVMTNISQAYAIYPEKPQLVDLSTIHKLEGLVTQGEEASPLPAFVQLMAPAPAEMARWLRAVHDAFYLYGCPGMPQIIPLPDERSLYLDPVDVANVPVDGHSLAATKQIFDRIAGEKLQQRQRSPIGNPNTDTSAASPFAPRPPTMGRSGGSMSSTASSPHANMQHSGIFAPSSHRQGHVHNPSMHSTTPIPPMNPNVYSPAPPPPIQQQMGTPSPPGSRNSTFNERNPHTRSPLAANTNTNPNNGPISESMHHPRDSNPMQYNYNAGHPGHSANTSVSSASVINQNINSSGGGHDRQMSTAQTSISSQMALPLLPGIPSMSSDLMGDSLHGHTLSDVNATPDKVAKKTQRQRKAARPMASDSEEDDDEEDEEPEEDDDEEKEEVKTDKLSQPLAATAGANALPVDTNNLLPSMGGLISSDINLSFLNMDPNAPAADTNTTATITTTPTEEKPEAPLSAAAKRRNRRLAKSQMPLPSDSEEEEEDDDDDDEDNTNTNMDNKTATLNNTGETESPVRPRTGSVPLLNEGRRPSMPFDWQSNNSEGTLPLMAANRPQSAHLLESTPAYPAFRGNDPSMMMPAAGPASVGHPLNQMRPVSHMMSGSLDSIQPIPGMEFMTPEERWRWEQQQQQQQQQMFMAQTGGMMQPMV
ncbi:hypothetical protein BDF19DRAFT_242640 [Syncephalis fuscata]|nr:hypothetical protein BDF19DRAFT_242640 [Syncephalis fuscata]